MNVLVVHDYGPLGHLLLERLKQTSLQISPLLISEPERVELSVLAEWIPEETDLIVNALWLSDPEAAEKDSETARQGAFSIPIALAEHARIHSMALFQLTTGYIFDGRKQSAYITSNPGQPFSQLGNWQWECEQALRTLLPRHLILRTGWSLGRYIQKVQHEGEAKVSLPFSSRHRGQPVSSRDLARVIAAMVLQVDCGAEVWGTYQYAGAEEVTQYDLGLAILGLGQLPDDRRIIDKVPEWAALEPENMTLGCTKIRNTFGIKQLPWRSSLADEHRLLEEDLTASSGKELMS